MARSEDGEWRGARSLDGPEPRRLGHEVVATVARRAGILNGLDLVDLDRRTLLTHVHAGTLGWITLSVFATAFWLFGASAPDRGRSVRLLAWAAGISIPALVAAFYIQVAWLSVAAGSAVLGTMVAMLAWCLMAGRSSTWTVPRWSFIAGLVTLIVGGSVGVVWQLQLASGQRLLLGDTIEAHVTAMAISYLVIVAMGVVEWRLLGDRPASRLGLAQVGLLFAGGLFLSLGLLVGLSIDVVSGPYLLAELIAVVIFIARVWRPVLRVRWLDVDGRRHVALAAVFIPIDIAILLYLIVALVTGSYGPPGEMPDLAAIPSWLIFSLDHAIFIGVMTNLVIGLLAARTVAASFGSRWADEIAFWGINVGMVGFVIGLALDEATLKRIFSPIMGTSILVALVVLAVRLWRSNGLAGTADEDGPGTA